MDQQLLPLKVCGGTISCSTGSSDVQIVRSLHEGVTASAAPPPQLSSSAGQHPSDWAVEAQKGVWLDLCSPTAGAYVKVPLGEVCGTAFLAAARIKLCWMAPTHSSSIAGLPRHIQFLLAQLAPEGPYAIILPLLPNNCKATLQPARQQPASNNALAVHLDSGNPDFTRSSWQAAVYVAAAHDPFLLCDVAVAAAAACLPGGSRPRWEKQLPEIGRYLGWCTWDAFYHSVSAQGIAAGLQSFRQAGVQPRWIIIDDGWQRTGLDGTAQALARQLEQQQGSGVPAAAHQQQQQPLHAVQQAWCLLWKHVLREAFGWVQRRPCWTLLLAALQQPMLAATVSWLLQAYNRATSEHSKRLLSAHQFNAKFRVSTDTNVSCSGVDAGPQADTSTAATSRQVLAFVQDIKQQYGLQHVFAWHATAGYWSGVSPAAAVVDAAVASQAESAGSAQAALEARAAAAAEVVLPRFGPVMSDLEPPTNWSQLVLGGIGAPQDPREFFSHLHSQLTSLGITGVKVDVQNQLELIGSAAGQHGGQVVAAAWHSALEDSVAANFPGNCLINCMCHNTADLFRMRDSSLARVSDDFYPTLPASHTTHVAVCAFNSLFFGPLLQPDWDMFHSKHPRALLHATARMISGGPVYVSDKPGRHDPTLLSRLALPGGRLLQPLLPGRPCRDCLFADVFRDGVSALKVWNMNACGGVLALFNVQGSNWSRSSFSFVTHSRKPAAVTATVQLADVWLLGSCMQPAASSSAGGAAAPGRSSSRRSTGGIQLSDKLSFTGQYVLYTDSVTQLAVVRGLHQGCTLELRAAESEVVTVAPMLELADACGSGSSSGSVLCAVVGLVNMLNPGGAVVSVRATQEQQQQLRSRDGSNNGGSGTDSGSWVMPVASAAADVPASESKAALSVHVVGCGELLLFASAAPARVELDEEAVGFSYDASSRRLGVFVPVGEDASRDRSLLVHLH